MGYCTPRLPSRLSPTGNFPFSVDCGTGTPPAVRTNHPSIPRLHSSRMRPSISPSFSGCHQREHTKTTLVRNMHSAQDPQTPSHCTTQARVDHPVPSYQPFPLSSCPPSPKNVSSHPIHLTSAPPLPPGTSGTSGTKPTTHPSAHPRAQPTQTGNSRSSIEHRRSRVCPFEAETAVVRWCGERVGQVRLRSVFERR